MSELNLELPDKLENALQDIYCVSGLGADERVFQKLKLEGYQPIHIRWVEPENGETINNYARRLTEQISSNSPILIGLSFGGIIAIEIAKQIDTKKVILISSTKNQKEVPFYFQIFRWLPIYRLIPAKIILWFGQLLAAWFFSLETLAERKLFRAILYDTNAKFVKWAIHQVVTWRNELIPKNLYHIHGESDRIFPYKFVREDFNVKKGGHFMIMNQAEYISNLIQKIVDI
ncbi:alpha/beta hydrolase [Waterburya agarophytonicola K14]|uniref:Alpha/beta hydrolase n=1 Tax=Waterburya agarophytonicola KI4 TaxID=2874699 RepID=A0A964FED9_9CYAN|nr:alpha/beta hydrolase [Waterburya agarophytonicola]MCC0176530.1 alpha/beta hydrolase [Waterburya agarophytonicola KI4]